MRVVGLISGGKDSCYNLLQCVAAGHQVVALAHMKPAAGLDELDSFMYQSVGQEAVHLYAEALDVPLYQKIITGTAVCASADYLPTTGDEVEAMHQLLDEVKTKEGVEAVSVGAIMSNYQRVRVENVCSRLGLTVVAYMWRRDQEELMAEMIAANLRATVIKVAAMGLSPSRHLGKDISEIFPDLIVLRDKFGLNVCGEGGEYETFTLDCPLFKKAIVVEDYVTVIEDNNDVAPVAYIKFKKLTLEPKAGCELDQREAVATSKIRGPLYFLMDLDVPLASIHDRSPCPKVPFSSSTLEPLSDGVHRPQTTHLGRSWKCFSNILALATDVAEATLTSLDHLVCMLDEVGMTTKDVVAVQLFVSNMANFATINESYKKYFGMNPPSRVCVQVPLPPNVLFQMECLAFGAGSCDDDPSRTTKHMHVQGISHWAPANIGPYSQAVQVGSLVHVAGQIPLLPATMELVGGGIVAQCRLSLRHVRRVLNAMDVNMDLKDVVYCICYVTHPAYADVAREEWMKASSSALPDQDLPSVDYVVVTGLPRDASVEWQVVAHSASAEPTSALKRTKVEAVTASGVSVAGTITTSPGGETILTTECAWPSDGDAIAQLTESFRYHKQLVEGCHHGPRSAAAHYQVFFDVALTSMDRLWEAWRSEKTCGGTDTLFPVPVLSRPAKPSTCISFVIRCWL